MKAERIRQAAWTALAAALVAVAAFRLRPPAAEPDVAPRAAPAPRPIRVAAPAAPRAVAPVPARAPREEPKDRNGTAGAPNGKPADAGPDAIPGEYVFGFFSPGDQAQFLALARRLGASGLATIRLGNGVRVRADPDTLRALLEQGPRPLHWGANHWVRLPDPPAAAEPPPGATYTGFGERWLDWMGVAGLDRSQWGNGIVVAVLDTGIANHQALRNAAIRRVLLGDGGAEAGDAAGHGTAVASLLAGHGDRVNGLAPAATLLDIPVLGADGRGDAFTLARGIVEAVDRGARIVNLSLGGAGDNPFLAEAVRYAREKGVVLVASAGNDGVEGVWYPAAYDGVLTVGSVDATGQSMYFSNRGAALDLAAPGLALAAAWGKDGEIRFSGTSASTPIVSAALAVLLSAEPTLSGLDAAAILAAYANDTAAPGRDDETGAGILDIRRALQRNVPGIYDMAACLPYVKPAPAGGAPTLIVYAQNRGTEPIPSATLSIRIGGVLHTHTFADVRVGESVGRELPVPEEALAGSGTVRVSLSVRPDGLSDANSADNAAGAVLRLKP